MPRIKLTKSTIDDLPAASSDQVYWDTALPGFGVKVTPKGRKVFIVLYRTGGAGSKLRKYTIAPYGRITLHQARVAAQKVFTAKLEGRDPAAKKREVAPSRSQAHLRIWDGPDRNCTARRRQNSQPSVRRNLRGRRSLSTPRVSSRAQGCIGTLGCPRGSDLTESTY